jgi:hypothetical protein
LRSSTQKVSSSSQSACLIMDMVVHKDNVDPCSERAQCGYSGDACPALQHSVHSCWDQSRPERFLRHHSKVRPSLTLAVGTVLRADPICIFPRSARQCRHRPLWGSKQERKGTRYIMSPTPTPTPTPTSPTARHPTAPLRSR